MLWRKSIKEFPYFSESFDDFFCKEESLLDTLDFWDENLLRGMYKVISEIDEFDAIRKNTVEQIHLCCDKLRDFV